MNTEESQNDEIIDTGKETTEEPTAPENSEQHWPEDEEANSPENKLKEEQERYLRLYSEFENFRRRTARERIELMQMAGKDVITSLLPVLDDLERAIKASDSIRKEHAALLEGFDLILKKMTSTLEGMGLKAMNSIGEVFDAELHEAVTKIPAPNDKMKGKVIDEVEKGYFMNEKVIRFAKVVVGE